MNCKGTGRCTNRRHCPRWGCRSPSRSHSMEHSPSSSPDPRAGRSCHRRKSPEDKRRNPQNKWCNLLRFRAHRRHCRIHRRRRSCPYWNSSGCSRLRGLPCTRPRRRSRSSLPPNPADRRKTAPGRRYSRRSRRGSCRSSRLIRNRWSRRRGRKPRTARRSRHPSRPRFECRPSRWGMLHTARRSRHPSRPRFECRPSRWGQRHNWHRSRSADWVEGVPDTRGGCRSRSADARSQRRFRHCSCRRPRSSCRPHR